VERTLGTCPFCQSSIDEDILLYGGSCPKCFGEIPGEEAATDPGDEVKERQERSDNRRILIRTLIPILLAVPVVGIMLIVAIGFIIWNQDPEVEVMKFDDFDIIQVPIVEADPDADPDGVADNDPKPRPTPKDGVKPRPTPNNDGSADANDDPGKLPEVRVQPDPKPGGLSFDGLSGPSASRKGAVLSDPGQIFEMIKKVMAIQQQGLTACYNQQLKRDETLEGRWRAYFTVNKQGRATNVRFEGANMSNAEFEACLANKVKKWQFSPISRPQPVEKSWRFRPN
jgi:outer membrane biosynthesis protein TonB